MVLLHLAPLALSAVLVAPAPLRVQHDTGGKIGDVQRSADHAKKKGSGDSGDGDDSGGRSVAIFLDAPGAFLNGVVAVGKGIYLLFTYVPTLPGQGYARYPYAGDGADGSFVRQGVSVGRTFGAASVSYFADDQSRLRATHVSTEWAGGLLHREIEFSTYAEPTPTGTDHLQMFRLTFAAAPRLGNLGYAKFGGGIQIVTLGFGDIASGPELEAGVQLFPWRPFGVSAAARVGPLTWNGGPQWGVSFADLTAAGSVFVGRFEIQAGYRWTRIGVGRPFRGPTLGMRVWF